MSEPDRARPSLTERLKRLLKPLRRAGARAAPSPRDAKFRQTYAHFREILSLNDSVLQLIADIDDRLLGHEPFAFGPMVQRVHRSVMNVLAMVKNLNKIADNRYTELYDVLRRVAADLELEGAEPSRTDSGPWILPIEKLRASDAAQAGYKMARLGEVIHALDLRVPPGFVVTAAAYARFMSRNRLWERTSQLEGMLEMFSPRTLAEACRDVQSAIRGGDIPIALENAILGAYDALDGGRHPLVSLRSSAVSEDSAASHAGLYCTELNVSRDLLLDTYGMVLASAFSPTAVSYRVERGLTAGEATMAVGCMKMLDPRCSGILFSRDFDEPHSDATVVSVISGLGAWLASGKQMAEELVVREGRAADARPSLMSEEELGRLVEAGRRLEAHFGGPQDVEWAMDREGALYILQTRPMAISPPAEVRAAAAPPPTPPLLEGGFTACPGAGTGPVFLARAEDDLKRFPQGAVLVARHSSPAFSGVMTRCRAILADVGSPTGHMSILAREFAVPTIVGLEHATRTLSEGQVVTVDASTRRVYGGEIPELVTRQSARAPLASSPAVRRLQSLARHVTPLNLINPRSAEFSPAHCRTLHDITRFVHEKVYHVMFRLGDLASESSQRALVLEAALPLKIHLFDLEGGLKEGAPAGERLTTEEILSVPMKSFLEGLMDRRIQWNKPRLVSARGFLSVLGHGIAGPPPVAQGVGGASYAVISDRYMNFSTRAGYHFSTVDAYCGESQNKNYVHFRFTGGGAAEDRRARRVEFLSGVLGRLDFRVTCRGDHLVARLEKYHADFIRNRLVDLGRLTLCARQLDMLMDTDDSPRFFAELFLKGELDRF